MVVETIFDEVVHVGDVGMEEVDDIIIWSYAHDGNWTIMSKDGDFADMALLYGAPPKVIRLRIGNRPWRTASNVVTENADAVRSFLANPESSLLVLSLQESL